MSTKTSGGQAKTGPFGGNNLGQVARHGTYSGATAHSTAGAPLCDPCRQARRDYRRARDLRRKRGYNLTLDEAYAELGLPADRAELASTA